MFLERTVVNELLRWKTAPGRKPLLIKGARQIGKTMLMEKFGKEHFEYCFKIDFERQPEYKSAFLQSKEPHRILKELALYSEVPIIPGKTLIIFDEIQECEEALNSLKYFCDDAPEYHVMAAGSSLGVAVRHRGMSVPVGKVEFLRMEPLTFREFLRSSDPTTFNYVEQITKAEHLPELVLNKLKLEYRRYMVCGGMPEAVIAMLTNQGMEEVDHVLQNILNLYEMDFSKYADQREIPRIHAIWHSLPAQLAKENRKFIYKVVRTGARAKDYEDALFWLEEADMIYRVMNITKPAIPLKAYEDYGVFKVYACDCGLLRRLANLSPSAILSNTSGYSEFKGAMAENAILQALVAMSGGQTPSYWSSGNRAEVEFVMQREEEIIPIEVKAENTITGRSLSVYNDKYHPQHRVRFSFLNLQCNGGLLSCPSPLAEWMWRWI